MRDDASTSSISVGVALLFLVPAMGVAITAFEEPSLDPLQQALLRQDAQLLLDVVTAPRGAAPDGWASHPDAPQRPTLLQRGASVVDAGHLDLLRRGGLEATANGWTDYPELKAALGATRDFHLSVRPLLPGLDDAEWEPLPGRRVAYLGHYGGASAAATFAATARANDTALNLSLNVTNRADAPAVFTATLRLTDARGIQAGMVTQRHTSLLAPGQTEHLWADFSALRAWDPALTHARVRISDPYGNLARTPAGADAETYLSLPTLPASGATRQLHLTAANHYYVASGGINAEIVSLPAHGAKPEAATARLHVLAPNGSTHALADLAVPKSGALTWRCPACDIPGAWTLRLLAPDGTILQTDRVHASAARMFTEKATIDPVAQRERDDVAALVAGFNRTRYDPVAAPGGDVFGDDANGPGEIAPLLPRYDTLVVGSDVAQSALSSADARHGIMAWVERGGALVVLGNAHGPSQWLESVYHTSLQRDAGSLRADPSHALLLQPEPLRHWDYPLPGRAWSPFPGAAFHSALSSADGRLVLAQSAPGALGDGKVILAAHRPGAFAAPLDDAEGRRLLHNLLANAQDSWSLDVGPPIPRDVTVASASRLLVGQADGQAGWTTLRVDLHVFGS